MRLKAFTLLYDAAAGGFDDAPVQEFLEGKEVLALYEHLLVHEGQPVWALLVTWRDELSGGEARRRRPRKDWRAELSEDEQPLYDALRDWRNQRARREGRRR